MENPHKHNRELDRFLIYRARVIVRSRLTKSTRQERALLYYRMYGDLRRGMRREGVDVALHLMQKFIESAVNELTKDRSESMFSAKEPDLALLYTTLSCLYTIQPTFKPALVSGLTKIFLSLM